MVVDIGNTEGGEAKGEGICVLLAKANFQLWKSFEDGAAVVFFHANNLLDCFKDLKAQGSLSGGRCASTGDDPVGL